MVGGYGGGHDLLLVRHQYAPLFVLGLGPPQSHLFRHHFLSLRDQHAVHTHTLAEGTVPLVTLHHFVDSVISTPRALRAACVGLRTRTVLGRVGRSGRDRVPGLHRRNSGAEPHHRVFVDGAEVGGVATAFHGMRRGAARAVAVWLWR